MYSVEAVGRLLQVRLASPLDAESAARFVEKSRLLMLTAREKVVTASDLRQLTVLSPEVADFMTTLMVRNGPKIERSSFLVVNLQSSLGMQLVRMMSASKSPGRRVFDRADEAASYLEEVLTEPERLALRKFLA